ncbi:MAG: response regulator [candidate division NC10 bacterium]|nr:response regulator [candidate division NC10 bacterium]MDE2322894.1 response regulator [candidate division NC10 bacterium]
MEDRIRILYAEDDPSDAALTMRRFALDAPECDLDIVGTGRACLDGLAQHDYDLLLLDYHLPDMDGLDVMQTATRQGYTLPVVLITGAGNEDLVVQAIRLGVTDYVTKRGDYLTALPQTLRRIAGAHRKKGAIGHLLVPSRPRILYVEHHASDVELLLRHFGQAAPHLTVQLAYSCRNALDLLREAQDSREAAPYDLVLIDLRMPEMSGLDLLRETKDRGISLPFVIVTGQRDEEVAVAALRLGAYDYIVKREGYLTQLPHVIDNAIARFHLNQAAGRLQAELGVLNRLLEHRVRERTAALEQEITERKQAEHALAASERLRRSILDSIEEGVYGLDLDGRIIFENPAALKIFGWQAHEILGQHSHTLMHHHRADGSVYPVEDCPTYHTLHDGQIRHVHNEVFFRKDGTSFPVEYTASALRDDAGVITGVVVSFRDITEFKQLQEQFVQSQKLEAIGVLAGGIAHDFNNNLSAILGFSDLALEKLRPDDPVGRYLEQVKKAGEQSAALTRQLLAFSRKQLLQPRVLELNALIAEDTTMLKRLIGEEIDLHRQLDPELGHIRADPAQLEQVLMNLVVNARDAMPQGGTLTIETGNVELDKPYACVCGPIAIPSGRYVRLAVIDTGCGMDAVTRARIFEPFFTTKELGKGTGLGLSTAYGIVKQSGGYICVYSTPGQGATFEIYLPQVDAPLEAGPLREFVTPLRPGAATVLLVDDDELVRTIARETLQVQGYTVLEAMNGGGALLISERYQGPIDLLLTDVVMPYMSGSELAQRLTAQRPATRVLYMSGYTDDTLAPHGVLAPGTMLLAKPLTPENLLRTVQEALVVSGHSAGGA